MSRPETLRAFALFLRARADVLRHGDNDAQKRARALEAEADEIDPQRQQQPEEQPS